MTTTYAATYPEAQRQRAIVEELRPFATVEIVPAYGLGYNVTDETRCRECGAPIEMEQTGDTELPVAAAEVYLNAETLRANAGGQSVLVDDIPESAFGPFLVHQEPCAFTLVAGRPRYELA